MPKSENDDSLWVLRRTKILYLVTNTFRGMELKTKGTELCWSTVVFMTRVSYVVAYSNQ